MGLHDILHTLEIQIDSDEAVAFNDRLFEFYSCQAMLAPSQPKKKGSYNTYEGSLWSKGILPIDSYKNLMSYRGKQKGIKGETLDAWQKVVSKLKVGHEKL